MRILKDIGLFRVFLGVESNSVAGLKALGRGIRREVNREAVRLLKDLDIHVTFNLLLFEPECSLADAELRTAVKTFLRDLNASNADLLERICRIAETEDRDDRNRIDAIAEALAEERAAFDETLRPRFAQLGLLMQRLVAERGRTRMQGWPGKAAAGVAFLALAMNSPGCERRTHTTEMVPAPTQPSEPEQTGAGTTATQSGTAESAEGELAPADVERIHQQLATEAFRNELSPIVMRHDMDGKSVRIELTLTAQGTVAAYKIDMPADDHPVFQKDLGNVIRSWAFKGIKSAGTATVLLRLEYVPTTGTFMCEMAPMPSQDSKPE